MSKPTKILCPIDLSEDNDELIQLASVFALEKKAELIFLYVAIAELPYSSGGLAIEAVEANIEKEKKKFESIHPASSDIKFRNIFARGNASEVIVETSKAEECEFIVIGTHGRTGLSRLLLGSVAEYVIRHADCPVLTLKPSQTKAA